MTWKKVAQNLFLIPATVIKQINTMKPFNMQPRAAVPYKTFVMEEENNFEEEISLASQDLIGNISCCKFLGETIAK